MRFKRLTSTSTNTYEWGAARRLVAIKNRKGVSLVTRSEFTHCGLELRTQIVEKQNGSVVSKRKFLWCGAELCEERDSNDNTVTQRLFGQGEQTSAANYFFIGDDLGSVREMTDSSGSIRARYDYDPFGRVTQVSGDLASDFQYTTGPARIARCHYQPWPLRLIAGVLIAVELLMPCNSHDLLAVELLFAQTTSSQAPASQPQEPAPVLTPQNVTVNRTTPQVRPPPVQPVFSEPPTDLEVFRAQVFADPLVPTGATTPEENKALALSLLAFLNRASNDDVAAVEQFLAQYPQSAWRASLLTDLGIVYRKTGYFSKALAAWEEAWQLFAAVTEPRAKAMADRAIGELAELNSRLGRYNRLESLFREIQGRDLGGFAAQKVTGAKEGLWRMRNRPEEAFLCGPYAVNRLRMSLVGANSRLPDSPNARSTLQGTSLAQLKALAGELKMDCQMAKREPGSKVLVPAVVHWKSGHFAALVKENDDLFQVHDPTFGDEIWVSQAALDAEATGYFLVPAGPLPAGWQSVGADEGQTVWGKGSTGASDPNCTRCYDPKSCANCQETIPMAQYSMHALLVSLNIVDTPVGYAPPRGPAVRFTLTYNQREAGQPANFTYSNLGKQWTFDWLAYITDDPLNQLANASYYVQGGGTEPYSNFDTSTQRYAPQLNSRTLLVRTSTNSYERQLPDGSKQIFNLPNGASAFPRKIFLTQVLDPSGNAISYTYDNNFRIVSVTDALNQVTTLSYGSTNSADPLFYKITQVTDPFGRYATFAYNGSGQLTNITDVIGISSAFTYGANDFITSLTTPYGTTAFTMGENGQTRWLVATDPLGAQERMEYEDNSLYVGESVYPSGVAIANNWLNYRNSFYWDKKAMQFYAADDYTKATKSKIYHWLHDGNNSGLASGILESEKDQLESRVWYTYPGQSFPTSTGSSADRSAVARVLDDGSSQIYRYEYNTVGKVTKVTDPLGRVTTNTYSTNLIDLLEVRQVVGSTTELLSSFTYNSQHLPLTSVDAAGQTNFFGYNSYGQLTATTNALNQTVTMFYDTNGYLTNITGALPGATTSFTYDGYGRVRTVTDSEGFTVTTDYDAADRPTKVTYPDGTYEQIVYDALDPVLTKDRRGHWTKKYYDSLRRLTDVEDALGRLTHFEWCNCGTLESIIDPLNHTTTWLRDLRGRVTAKIYPDTTQVNYTYETSTSRLRKVTDAKNQSTVYDYYVDNNLKQVTYTNAVVATPTVSFTYETNYNRILTMTDGNGTNTYSYYAVTNGQLGAGKLHSLDGPWANDTITYAYDELGRVKSRTIDNVAVDMTYDPLGRVTVVTNALGTFTNNYVNTTPRVSSMVYPNGQTTTFSYFGNTNDQRLQTIWHQNSSGATVSKFDYIYDADGQIATWTQQADDGTPNVWVTEYDPVDQLLGVTVRSNSITGAILKQFIYAYDKAGNRSSEQIQSGAGVPLAISTATHNNLNQLTGVTGGGSLRFKGSLSELGTVTVGGNAAAVDSRTTNFVGYAQVSTGTNIVAVVATDYNGNSRTNNYQVVVTNNSGAKTLTYDLNGNLSFVNSATSTNTYEWDAVDRLTKITQLSTNSPELVTEFTYDGSGRRTQIVEKQNGSVVSTKKFLWCDKELCEERDAIGATVIKRFFAQGEQISGTNYFFTRDHLGSVREMTESSQAIRARHDYDPYGRRTRISGDLEANFAFTGHYYHAVSGLYLTLYRAYDSDIGRWLNRDPIMEESGINLYGFVRNAPTQFVDPFGDAEQGAPAPAPPIILPPGGGAGSPGSIVGPPGFTGSGNNTTTGPGVGCWPLNSTRNVKTVPFTCPCTAVQVQCELGDICSDTGFSIPSFGVTGQPKPLYVWKPYRKCPRCPEGQY